MTLKLLLLGRFYQALSKSIILGTLWLHWVWLWRPFSPTLKLCDTWPISEIRPEKNFILIFSFRITIVSIDDPYPGIDRRFRRVSKFRMLGTLTLTFNDLEIYNVAYVSLSSIQIAYKLTVLSTPLSFIVTAFFATFYPWLISKIRLKKILYWSLVTESLVRPHPWFISWDEIHCKVGRISKFERPVTYNTRLNDLETYIVR